MPKQKEAVKETKSLGKQIDSLFVLDRSIKSEQSKVDELKRKRARLETKLLQSFDKADIDGCKGKKGTAVLLRQRHAKIGNRAKLLKYIKRNDAFDLFQNRISTTAYFDRLDEGEKVPGIEVWEDTKVSVRKRKG